MSKRRDALMVLVALVAGLVGGVVSNWFLISASVFAQKAPQHEKVVQAERFEVVDQAGNVRALLGAAVSGSPHLEFYDQAEKLRAGLGMTADGIPSLTLYDQDKKLRAEFGMKSDGNPTLRLSGANKQKE